MPTDTMLTVDAVQPLLQQLFPKAAPCPSYCPARSRCVNPTLLPDTLGCARCRLSGLVCHDGV